MWNEILKKKKIKERFPKLKKEERRDIVPMNENVQQDERKNIRSQTISEKLQNTVESGNLKSLDEFHCAFLGNTKHKF